VYIEILPLTQDQTDKGAPEKLNGQKQRRKGKPKNSPDHSEQRIKIKTRTPQEIRGFVDLKNRERK